MTNELDVIDQDGKLPGEDAVNLLYQLANDERVIKVLHPNDINTIKKECINYWTLHAMPIPEVKDTLSTKLVYAVNTFEEYLSIRAKYGLQNCHWCENATVYKMVAQLNRYVSIIFVLSNAVTATDVHTFDYEYSDKFLSMKDAA